MPSKIFTIEEVKKNKALVFKQKKTYKKRCPEEWEGF